MNINCRLLLPSVIILQLFFALSLRSQEKTESAPAAPTYANTKEGLRQLLQDVLAAARRGDKDRVAIYVRDMEIPNYESWYYKTFDRDKAESWIEPYRADLEKNNSEMCALLQELAQQEGEVTARYVNDDPEPGHGMEWGMFQSAKQHVDFYFAGWRTPANQTSKPDPIGYFLFIDGGFRWDSGVHFMRKVNGVSLIMLNQSGTGASAPIATFAPDAVYPERALKAGRLPGSQAVVLVVDSHGSARDVRVLRSLGNGLDETAVETVKHWKFKPAMKNGQPVAVQVLVQVNFRPKN